MNLKEGIIISEENESINYEATKQWNEIFKESINILNNTSEEQIDESKKFAKEIIEYCQYYSTAQNIDIEFEEMVLTLLICLGSLFQTNTYIKNNIQINKDLGFIDNEKW